MKGGLVQADLYLIIIIFKSIVKHPLENTLNLAEYPLVNPGKKFYFTVGYPVIHFTCQQWRIIEKHTWG